MHCGDHSFLHTSAVGAKMSRKFEQGWWWACIEGHALPASCGRDRVAMSELGTRMANWVCSVCSAVHDMHASGRLCLD